MVRRDVYPGPASFVVGGRIRYDEVVGLEDEPAAAGVLGHPQKRDFRKPRVAVAATDVAVSPGEPDLLERLIFRIVGRTETVDGDAERADGVPDADEVDVHLRVRIRAPGT